MNREKLNELFERVSIVPVMSEDKRDPEERLTGFDIDGFKTEDEAQAFINLAESHLGVLSKVQDILKEAWEEYNVERNKPSSNALASSLRAMETFGAVSAAEKIFVALGGTVEISIHDRY